MTTSAPHNTHPIALPLLHLLHILSSLYILNNSPFCSSPYIPCSQPFWASNGILNQPINFIRQDPFVDLLIILHVETFQWDPTTIEPIAEAGSGVNPSEFGVELCVKLEGCDPPPIAGVRRSDGWNVGEGAGEELSICGEGEDNISVVATSGGSVSMRAGSDHRCLRAPLCVGVCIVFADVKD